MNIHRIAVIPGDGIGKEVMPEGVRALDAASRRLSASSCTSTTSTGAASGWSRPASGCRTTGRTRSAATTRSSSARPAGRRSCRTTSRCGIRSSSSAATSTSTSTCGRCGSCPASPARSRAARLATSTTTWCARTPTIGATVGVMRGGQQARQAQQQQAQAQQQQQQAQAQQAQAAQQAQRDTFNKGFAACMEGKGYTVK